MSTAESSDAEDDDESETTTTTGEDSSIDPQVGLTQRPKNHDCQALPRPQLVGGAITAEPLPGSPRYPNRLTDMRRAPVGLKAWFYAAQEGEVWFYPDGGEGQRVISRAFFDRLQAPSDVSGPGHQEVGLLSMAFDEKHSLEHPDQLRVFVYYSAFCESGEAWLCNYLKRIDLDMRRSGDALVVEDPGEGGRLTCETSSRCQELLHFEKPRLERDGQTQSALMHNGGAMVFGPDGHLYLNIGDGGSHVDGCHPQNLSLLLGKIVRLDVRSSDVPYAIPESNPYAGRGFPLCNSMRGAESRAIFAGRSEPCPEIVATGLRNPFRSSIDEVTGHLWFGDVGSEFAEEIDHFDLAEIQAGQDPINFGWPMLEGEFAEHPGEPCAEVRALPQGAPGPLRGPSFFFDGFDGASRAVVIPGHIYRGTSLAIPYGSYVFGERLNGHFWAIPDAYRYEGIDLNLDMPPDTIHQDGASAGFMAGAAGIARDGSELFVHFDDPAQLVNLDDPMLDFPSQLEATGCVVIGEPQRVVPGALPYKVQAELWSDGAVKDRFLALPPEAVMTLRSQGCTELTEEACAALGAFELPIGAVLIKVFRVRDPETEALRPVETRLLMRHEDGGWGGYTYTWNAEGTRAILEREGRPLDWIDWRPPSESDCVACHGPHTGGGLGMEALQLNRLFDYPGGTLGNQLDTLHAIGMLQANDPRPGALRPALVDPRDESANLADRARAYLHVNCAGCHHPDNTQVLGGMDLRYTQEMEKTGLCDVSPHDPDNWPEGTKLLVPGRPGASLLSLRMHATDPDVRMPPVGSYAVDDEGVALIDAWIAGMSGCR